MRKRLILLIVILMGTLPFYFSCEKKGGTPPPTPGELINKGWQKFQAQNFAGAGSDFSAALSVSTLRADSSNAFLGLGWAQLRRNQGGLAEISLVKYLSLAPGGNDGRAGLAFAYLATDKFKEAIDTANVVLSSEVSWSFGRDNSINHLDLRLLLAQCYYDLGEYSASLEIVRYFDSGFNVDIKTPEGRRDLAEKIHSLWTG